MNRMVIRRILPWTVAAISLGLACASPAREPATSPANTAPEITLSHLPKTVWTVPEGNFWEASARAASGYAQPHNLTWLFHLVMTSKHPRPLAIDSAGFSFTQAGTPLWTQTWSHAYLQRMEWLEGAFDMTAEYYLTRVLHGSEVAIGPDLQAGATISWVRIPLAAHWFADADTLLVVLHFKDGESVLPPVRYSIPVTRYRQKTTLRLPVNGIWAANAGNDLSTGHRRTGLNGLTNYAWDFVKLGPDGRPYRTDGKTPQDYYTFREPALAAADGVVVHVRDNIPEFGVGEAPPADLLREDGDAFAGNLVVLDHGNGEFSLTSHLLEGTVAVKIGEKVTAGQRLGLIGNSGYSGVPHVHFNLMDSGSWLEANGLPSLFSDFERLRTGAPPETIPLGNPMSSWLVQVPRR